MKILAGISLATFAIGILLFMLGVGNGKGPDAGFMMLFVFGILIALYAVTSFLLAIVVLLSKAG